MNINVQPYLEKIEGVAWKGVNLVTDTPGDQVNALHVKFARASHYTGWMGAANMIISHPEGEPVRNLLAFTAMKPSLN